MEANKGADEHLVKDLKRIVEENIDDHEFSLEDLSRLAGLSRSQLYRRIKLSSGISLSLFIRKVRLQKAKLLLDNTTQTITEVSYKCGISSPQNFTKYFAAEFGLSPSEYRKLKQAQPEDQPAKDTEIVSVVPSHAPPEITSVPESTQTVAASPKILNKQTLILITLAMVLVLGAIAAYWKTRDTLPPNNNGETISVAVIPFKNYSSVKDDFLGEGVVEDVLTHLTMFRNIRVISRTSSEQYRDTEKSIPQIGKELSAQYVLEGSIRQSDGKIRITTQLIETATDSHIWARNYDRSKGDIMDIQSEIALDIARTLNKEINPDVEKAISALPTENEEAYKALLRGRYLLSTREKEALESSIIEFDRALALDPYFSDAYSGKAAAYYLLRDSYFEQSNAKYYLQQAEENAKLAISEDQSNAQAFAYLGHVYIAQYNWEAAASTLEIALNLNPSDAQINYWYGNVFRGMLKVDEALKYHTIAYELDPLYPVIHAGYSYTCALSGRHAKAEKLLNDWSSVFERSFLHELTKGVNLILQEKYAEAIPYLEQSVSINPNFETAKINRIYCLGKLGKRSEVESYINAITTDNPSDNVRAVLACLSIGDEEKAVDFLKKAADLGRIDTDILLDPRYEPILNHPTVLQVLREYGLYQYLPGLQ